MNKNIFIQNKIKSYKKKIDMPGDKSISIRWALLASQAIGISRAYNLPNSDDINSALNAVRKIGIKVIKKKNYCEIIGNGLNGFLFKNNTIINAGNSGTLSRLLPGLLAKSKNSIIVKGDKSLSKRDFSRIIKPLNLFGINIKSRNNKLPLKITGTDYLRPIVWNEILKSAQVKTSICLAALNTPGITKIRLVGSSRDHTERLFKYLNIPLKIKRSKNFDIIEIKGCKEYKGFNYNIPGDISSSAFFIILTALNKNSQILIKNINVNKTRTGLIDILRKMNVYIKLKNQRIINNEPIADIFVKGSQSLKAIKCPEKIVGRLIDELPILFLICSLAKGTSTFKKIGELRHKESDRLKICSNFLKMIGIKVKETKDGLKIFGNPNLKNKKFYEIKNFMKDHRIFMMSCIAALTLGGKWKIHDKNSINSSFPEFISKLKFLGAKII